MNQSDLINITNTVNQLIKSCNILESSQLSVPSFHTLDLYSIFKSQFNLNAQHILTNKVKSLLYDSNAFARDLFYLLNNLNIIKDINLHALSNIEIVSNFGYTVTEDKLASAILKLIDVINNLAINNSILATLEPLSVLKLACLDRMIEPQRYIVLSYLHLNNKHKTFIENTYRTQCMFFEGGLPPEFI